MRVVVTGASGFVGQRLVPALEAAGHEVVTTSTRPSTGHVVPAAGLATDWRSALRGADAVVHLAAKVHDREASAAEFRSANEHATAALGAQAAEAGTRRIVFLSTVGVVGSAADGPVNEGTPVSPANSYASSKYRAENRLLEVTIDSALEVVILRVPLIFGKGAPGSIRDLQRLTSAGIPVPVSRTNRRSAIHVENLALAIAAALTPQLEGGSAVMYVTDGTVWSSSELLRYAAGFGARPARMIHKGGSIARPLLHLAGRRALADRLYGDLVVDGIRFCDWSGWKAAQVDPHS